MGGNLGIEPKGDAVKISVLFLFSLFRNHK